MPQAHTASDKYYYNQLSADARITATIEAAIALLNDALEAKTDRAQYYCVTEAVGKLKELEGGKRCGMSMEITGIKQRENMNTLSENFTNGRQRATNTGLTPLP